MKNNYIKIIFGKLKGKKIIIPKKLNIKPTKSIVKRSFIDIIKKRINNSICLELFSGSGSMSLELISLGSNKVYLLEKNKKVFKNILKNFKRIKVSNDKFKLYNIDCIDYLKYKKKKFDIIIIDPPYSFIKYEYLLKMSFKILKNKGIIYLEASKYRKFSFLKKLKIIKIGKSGRVIYYIINKK